MRGGAEKDETEQNDLVPTGEKSSGRDGSTGAGAGVRSIDRPDRRLLTGRLSKRPERNCRPHLRKEDAQPAIGQWSTVWVLAREFDPLVGHRHEAATQSDPLW